MNCSQDSEQYLRRDWIASPSRDVQQRDEETHNGKQEQDRLRLPSAKSREYASASALGIDAEKGGVRDVAIY
jgi:hypothetical protein